MHISLSVGVEKNNIKQNKNIFGPLSETTAESM